MSDESKPSLLIYSNLIDDEQAKLEPNENTISTMLLTELGIGGGACWTSDVHGGQRTIRLIAANHEPETIFEISAMDLAERSSAELLLEITHAIRQI